MGARGHKRKKKKKKWAEVAIPYSMKVLIVGAGLTGSLVAALFSKVPGTPRLTIWEKESWIGGRTLTYRHPTSQLHVDMGAQYISRTRPHASSDYTRLKDSLYDELLSDGVLVPFCDSIEGVTEDQTKSTFQNYQVPKGFSTVVKHFLANSAADLMLGHDLLKVTIMKNGTNSTAHCKCSSGDSSGHFDVVILSMPTPELLQVKGNLFAEVNKEILSSLFSITYVPRYALGLFYEGTVRTTKWSSRYFEPSSDDKFGAIIRYASWGSGKVCGSDEAEVTGCTLLLHSGIEFATMHQETDKEKVKSEMMLKLDELVPGLPLPSHSNLVNWKHARANRVPAYHNTPGCLVLSYNPMVIATGDGLCDSNFESCVKAAQVTVQTVMTHLRLP